MAPVSPATRILLVDDHEAYRQQLRALLEEEPDFDVVAEAEDGQVALRLVGELEPDAVVMDVALPHLNGILATGLILASFPRVKVLALSMHRQRSFIDGMFAAGASGYVLKENAAKLPEALRIVIGGGTYLCPALG